MGFCPNCGRKIEENAKVCPHCFTQLQKSGFDENLPGGDPNWGDTPGPYDSNPTTYDDNPTTYDNGPTNYDGNPTTYDNGHTTFDNNPTDYDGNSTFFDDNGLGMGAGFGGAGTGAGNGMGAGPDGYGYGAGTGTGAGNGNGGTGNGYDGYGSGTGAGTGTGSGTGGGPSFNGPGEPSSIWEKISAAVAGFFGDGPENKSFIVVGVALLAVIVVVGGLLAHGLFFRKSGSTGPGEVASNTGVTSSSTGANTGSTAKPSSTTGKDNTDVIDTTPTEEMKKRQEEAEKRKAEKAEREAEEQKAAEQKKSEEAKKSEDQMKSQDQENSEKAKEEAAKERHAEEAKKKAEEDAKKKAEEDAKKKAEEDAKKKAEEDAKKKAEEEAKKKAEEDAKKKAEEDKKNQGGKDQTPAETPAESETGKYATAEEAFEQVLNGKSFLYGQQYAGYITDPEEKSAGPVGLDFSEVPEGEVADFVYDFDDDGTNELLVLELKQDGTVLARMYEYNGEEAVEEDQKLIEIDDKENGRKTVCRMIGGVPAFADAFVYRVDDEIRIGFEFAHTAVHANGTEHNILSYAYEGNVLVQRDYYGLEGSTVDMDVKYDRNFYKEMYEAFVNLGAGAMSADDIASMWKMETHFIDYMKDVQEIYRVENSFSSSDYFDYAKWEEGGKERTEFSKIRFAELKDLFKGTGPKYKEPVPFPEEEEKKTDDSQQDQNAGNGQQDQNTGNGGDTSDADPGSDNANTEKQSEQTTEPATDENSKQNTETPSDNSGSAPADDNAGNSGEKGSDSMDLSFLDGVWERIGGQIEGYSQPTIVFEGNVAHYHTDVSDFDVAVREIVKTDYGCFLRLDDGTYQYGFRWDASDPNVLSHVENWDTEDLSTYSGSDSYMKVK